MKHLHFDEVIVESGSESSPIYRNLRRTLGHLSFKVVDGIGTEHATSERGDRFGAAKKTLHLARHRG